MCNDNVSEIQVHHVNRQYVAFCPQQPFLKLTYHLRHVKLLHHNRAPVIDNGQVVLWSIHRQRVCKYCIVFRNEYEYIINYSLELICCEYNGLEFPQEVDTFNLKVNDTIEGGEVFENGRQTAFDLIKNIRRTVGPNGQYVLALIESIYFLNSIDHDTKSPCIV